MAIQLFYRRLTQEEMNDAPKGNWKEKLLYAINLFFQQTYTLLNNGLTPETSCICQTKTFQLVGSSTASKNTYSFTANYPYQPLGRDLINVQPTNGSSPVFTSAPHISWNFVNGVINILGISGLTDGVPYTFTVRFWWTTPPQQ